MKTLVEITVRCYENKDWNDKRKKPDCESSWIPKQFEVFNLYADADDFFYSEEKCIEAIKKLLEQESGSLYKYEYYSHKLVFNEPKELNSASFEILLLEEVFPELKK